LLFDALCEENAYFEKVGHKDTISMLFDGANREIGFMCDRLFSKSTSALAKALLLGDKDSMTGIMERDFRRIGISHLLALSGMHLALFTVMIMCVCKYAIPYSKGRFAATIVIALSIMLLTGASPSITRAALMVVYYNIGNLIRKQHDLITTLFAVTLTIVLFDPYMIFDSGLILSFAATFGIALLSSPINRLSLYLFRNPLKLSIPEKILKFAVDSVCISFAAGMFVNIAVILIFDSMSLLTIFTTMIFTPLIVCFIVVAALALMLSGIPYVSAFLLSSSELLSDAIIHTSKYFSSLNDITVSTHHSLMYVFIAVFILGFAYIVAKNKTAISLIIFTVVLQLIFSLALTLQIKVFNRDATLTQICVDDSEGFIITNIDKTAIIDNSYAVSAYEILCSRTLSKLKTTEIDKLVLTHYHQKHISFIKDLSELYIIRSLYIPMPVGDTDTSYALDIAEAADHLGIKLEYYSPYEPINTVNDIDFVALPYVRSGKTSHPKLAFTLESSEYVLLYSAGYSFDEDRLSDVDFFLSGVHGKITDPIPKSVEAIPPGASVRTLLKYTHP
jgi:competence protein ComEC